MIIWTVLLILFPMTICGQIRTFSPENCVQFDTTITNGDTTVQCNETQIDSVFKIILAAADFTEEHLIYNLLDSLVLFPELTGRGRTFRAAYIDSVNLVELPEPQRSRWASQRQTDRRTALASQERIGLLLYYSKDELLLVEERFVYQALNKSSLHRLFAVDSTRWQGTKFLTLLDMEASLTLKRAGYARSTVK